MNPQVSLDLFAERLLDYLYAARPIAARHLFDQLRKVQWMRPTTDDIYRCCVCNAENTHKPDCPVLALFPEGKGWK